MQLLYATTNPGKVMEVRKHLLPYGIDLVSPMQVGSTIEVEETGQTLTENAILKVEAYRAHASHLAVMADDTGVEIAALQGEPGIHVRRWQDKQTPMSDEAIIAYCLDRLRGVPVAQWQARMRTVIALAMPGASVELFDGKLDGVIVETPTPLRYPGFPFESLLYIPAWHKMLGDIHALSSEEKRRQGFFTHRERAVEKALPCLQSCLRAAATAAKR